MFFTLILSLFYDMETPKVSPPCDIKRLGYNFWLVKFWGEYLETMVTSRASDVDRWIDRTIRIHRFRLQRLIVGLDTEWGWPIRKQHQQKHHQKVATIQLCVGHRCLVFQICHGDKMPASLAQFLRGKMFTFVGKGVETDAVKLFEDYRLKVARTMDVSDMAASKYDDEELRGLGLRRLALEFLNVDMEKSKRVTLSRWDRKKLSKRQIQYAAIDAFVSFKLAIELKRKPEVFAKKHSVLLRNRSSQKRKSFVGKSAGVFPPRKEKFVRMS